MKFYGLLPNNFGWDFDTSNSLFLLRNFHTRHSLKHTCNFRLDSSVGQYCLVLLQTLPPLIFSLSWPPLIVAFFHHWSFTRKSTMFSILQIFRNPHSFRFSFSMCLFSSTDFIFNAKTSCCGLLGDFSLFSPQTWRRLLTMLEAV